MLATFTDVCCPEHLLSDTEGHLLVADFGNHRILLLSSALQLERVLVDTNSEVKLHNPNRLYYNELSSQLYVVHVHDSDLCSSFASSDEDDEDDDPLPYCISVFSLAER